MSHELVSVEALTERVEAIFVTGGFSADHAAALGRAIVAGERDGCKSHGIYRIAGCLRTLEAGKVVPDADPEVAEPDGVIIRVDAKGGFSNLAFARGLPVLAEQARKSGLAALVINDCVHFAALWPEIEDITAEGLAGMAMCPSYATVAPVGGTEPLLGTNPFAFGWPREGKSPYVFDFATSVVARGEIELYRRAGNPLPEGWALDADGQPTTSPEAALDGAMLPFGGHKGSAISTMIELLAGALIGDFTSDKALEWLGTTTIAPRHGELVLAFDPERFAGGRADPRATAEAFIGAIEGQGARLPGQRRFAARAEALRDGIPLTKAELDELDRLEKEGAARAATPR
ncbi:Ldh family oxidoreductase [Limimaricola cinnabarinus]|jgi:LDH2 family malate/lactate/ureidoglycolate dehydrogenase|uniref:Oxidoreductase n=1 Tax=Limimaricola cinnabarinus TaxID=1125964 RepID=A0A2G1MHE3_9RHOB|nr:Ldh family oxidoreductase [Limimaricola cinnabarinus]PHP28148.1 oxidoreductase [Limimaricola cinnabarinus]